MYERPLYDESIEKNNMLEEITKLRTALTQAVKYYDDLGVTQPWMAKAREVLKS